MTDVRDAEDGDAADDLPARCINDWAVYVLRLSAHGVPILRSDDGPAHAYGAARITDGERLARYDASLTGAPAMIRPLWRWLWSDGPQVIPNWGPERARKAQERTLRMLGRGETCYAWSARYRPKKPVIRLADRKRSA
jgi:hypothetical protein